MHAPVTLEAIDNTIEVFARLDRMGDRKQMNKLALRLQKEQPHVLQFAASLRSEHGDKAGEAGVFYCTLVWAMFDAGRRDTLPRLGANNLLAAQKVVAVELPDESKPAHERITPTIAQRQPHIAARLRDLLEEDVREHAIEPSVAAAIVGPTQVVVESFDAALSGRMPGEKQGTIIAPALPGRNDPCHCGSTKKFKKCHGA